MPTHEQNQKSLKRLKDWRTSHPGLSDGGHIRIEGEDEPEDFREEEETPAETEQRAQEFFQSNIVSKIFVALARAPQQTLNRNDIRARVLDSQLTAAELDALRDSNSLIAKFIELDYSRIHPNNKKPIERWVLKSEYKNHIDLAFIFCYTPPQPEKKPEPKRAISTVAFSPPPTPGPDGQFSIEQLVKMPWREFSRLDRDTQRLLPNRSGTMNDSPESQALWQEELRHWPLVETERVDSQKKLRKTWVRDMPENYHFVSAELSRLEWAEKNVLHIYLNGTAGEGLPIPLFLTPNGEYFDLLQSRPRTDLLMVRGEPVTGNLMDAQRRKIYRIGAQPTPAHRLVPGTKTGDADVIWSDAPPKHMSPAELAAVKPPPIRPVRVSKSFVSTTELIQGVTKERREQIYAQMDQENEDKESFERRRGLLLPQVVWTPENIAKAWGEVTLREFYAKQRQATS